MTAKELIDALSKLPPDLPVGAWNEYGFEGLKTPVVEDHAHVGRGPCIVLDWDLDLP